jgi:hypothetical protein
MTEHALECDRNGYPICICDRLRPEGRATTGQLECVWPDECQPACNGCARMEELLNERGVGYMEGLNWLPKELTRIKETETNGMALGIISAVSRYVEDVTRAHKDSILLPVRTDGIISEDMRMATNLSLGKATAGSLIKFLAASPPDCPVTVSPDGVFLVVLNTPA